MYTKMIQKNIISRINDTQWRIFMAITGGGQTFIGDYLSVSGASRVIQGAFVPYSKPAFDKFVGTVSNYVGDVAARKLAVASFDEAVRYGIPAHMALGLGVSSSLAKDGEREGREHRIHVAIHKHDETEEFSLLLQQGRTREEEEAIANDYILQCLAWSTGVLQVKPSYSGLKEGEKEKQGFGRNGVHTGICKGTAKLAFVNFIPRLQSSLVVYPGSWNPFHAAHQAIYDAAQQVTGSKPVFELSIANVDKGRLDYIEIAHRCEELQNKPYVLTMAPTFDLKAHLFAIYNRPIVFVVGADTWSRVWDRRYSGHLPTLERLFTSLNVRFLVFGREGDTIKSGYEHLRIMDDRATNFNMSISSSQLRG